MHLAGVGNKGAKQQVRSILLQVLVLRISNGVREREST